MRFPVEFCEWLGYRAGMENKPIGEDPLEDLQDASLGHLESMFGKMDHDVIACGHHHPGHVLRSDRTLYINPGSLGCSRDALARYAVIGVSDHGIRVKLDAAVYDKELLRRSFEKKNIPGRQYIMESFHGF